MNTTAPSNVEEKRMIPFTCLQVWPLSLSLCFLSFTQPVRLKEIKQKDDRA